MCLLQLAQLQVQASTTGCPATSGLRGLSPPCELSAFSYVKKKRKGKNREATASWDSTMVLGGFQWH
jgi:hypothetical protein